MTPRAGYKYILRTEPLYSACVASDGAAPGGSVGAAPGDFDVRWPRVDGEADGERRTRSSARTTREPAAAASCPLEQPLASELECPTCS